MATTTRKRPKGVSASDYSLATALKDEEYGPQIGAVQDLFRQAHKQYVSDIDSARAAEAATRANVKAAIPRVRDIYTESGRSQAATASEVDQAMAARPATTNPVAAAYQASLERERGTAARQGASAKADALSGLETRRLGAGSAREASVNQARKAYGESKSQLGQKLSDLLGARGAGISAELARLTGARSDASAKAAEKGGEINKYGYTDDDWRAMSTDARQKVIRDFGKSGKGKKGGKGPDWLPQGQAAGGLRQLSDLKKYAGLAKQGEPFLAEHGQGKHPGSFTPLSRSAAERKMLDNLDQPNHPMLLRAALDAVYDGHISAYTVKGLIKAGYKPSEVAETLKVLTSGQYKKTHPSLSDANTRAYGNQGNLGRTGHK